MCVCVCVVRSLICIRWSRQRHSWLFWLSHTHWLYIYSLYPKCIPASFTRSICLLQTHSSLTRSNSQSQTLIPSWAFLKLRPANVQPTHSPTHTYTFGCVTPFDAHTYPRECKYSNTFVYCYCRLWLSGGIDVVIWLSTVDTPETTNRAEAQ